ncbi:MAG: site-specific integrase [Syntrophomonadaceae bacterium]
MRGFVRKRKDGRYEGRIELPPDKDGNRHRKYVYGDSRPECQRMVNEIVCQLQNSDFADAGRLTVDAYMEEWYKSYAVKLASTTKLSHKNYVFKHIMSYFQGFKLKDLKPMHIEQFYNEERQRCKEKTILQVHRIFSRALKDAVKNSLISRNPCAFVDAPRPAEFEPNIPDVDTFWAILSAAQGTEHELPVMLAGLCGLRRGEVFGLTWNDIDFNRGTLKVRQVLCQLGKEIEIKAPKTRKSARTIGIPADLLAVLEQRKSVGYLASRDGQPTILSHYSLRFTNFLKRNNLPAIRFHDLRHFHATLMLEAGLDIRFVQSRLGHSNINMTAHYQHVRPAAEKEVVGKIDEHLRWSKRWSKTNSQQKS